ncbi:hypothetical protein ACN28S_19965 [Cystobacter fuscus]
MAERFWLCLVAGLREDVVREAREVDDWLGKLFVEVNIPVRVMLLREGLGAQGFQFIEGREAAHRCVRVAGVAEPRENVVVLVAGEPIGIGNQCVNGSADGPARVLIRQHRPCEWKEVRLPPVLSELFLPERTVSRMVRG